MITEFNYHAVIVVLLICTAGCIGPDLIGGNSAKDAENRALAAEENHLQKKLENASRLHDWGTIETTTRERANVINSTAEGIFVHVEHPFSYSKPAVEADASSSAVYLITPTEAKRVRGDQISPC